MPVTDKHPQYKDSIDVIQRCRDVYAGQKAVKNRGSIKAAGDATCFICDYFPMFSPANPSRYARVLSLASFTNFTGHTVNNLVGAAFNKLPEISLPDSIAYLENDCDGGGSSLLQLSKNGVTQNTVAGRHGFLTSYPSTGGKSLSVEETKRLGLQASIQQYPAESIINWGMNGSKLSYVVLREEKLDQDQDMFGHASKPAYRVLWLKDVDGEPQYWQQLVEDGGQFDKNDGFAVTDYNGKPFNEITFVIAGSVDNKPNVDKPPILDMSDANIAHFQIDAAESENLSVHGQTTIVISTSQSSEEFKECNPDGVSVGANAGIQLSADGKATAITAPESSALPAAKKAKQDELVAIGANLIDRGAGAKTIKEAGVRAQEATSIMQNTVLNVSDAIEQCCKWAERMMSPSPREEITFKISTEFFDSVIEPDMYTAMLAGVDREVIPRSVVDQVTKQAFPNIDFPDDASALASEGG